MRIVTPLKDMVLVRRLPDEEKTQSGLHLPAIALNPERGRTCRRGEVLAVGRGDIFRRGLMYSDETKEEFEYDIRHQMHCKVGDVVLYARCPDNDVTIDGVECVLLREEQHVLAILEGA